MLLMCALIHAGACVDGQEASANGHKRKSVSEWEEAGWVAGAVAVADMASVHLSVSKHSPLSPLSTGGEVVPFFFSPSAFPSSPPSLISAQPSLQTHLSGSHPLYFTCSFPSFFISLFLYFPRQSLVCCFHFHSALLLLPLCLSMEQPIQQQNKAASSITRWLIKRGPNSAASILQHQATGEAPGWRGGGASPERSLGRMNIQTAMMPIKDNAGDNRQVFQFQALRL